jgi:hypothetical protein
LADSLAIGAALLALSSEVDFPPKKEKATPMIAIPADAQMIDFIPPEGFDDLPAADGT